MTLSRPLHTTTSQLNLVLPVCCRHASGDTVRHRRHRLDLRPGFDRHLAFAFAGRVMRTTEIMIAED